MERGRCVFAYGPRRSARICRLYSRPFGAVHLTRIHCTQQLHDVHLLDGHELSRFFPGSNGGDSAILFCFVFLYLVFVGPEAFAVRLGN